MAQSLDEKSIPLVDLGSDNKSQPQPRPQTLDWIAWRDLKPGKKYSARRKDFRKYKFEDLILSYRVIGSLYERHYHFFQFYERDENIFYLGVFDKTMDARMLYNLDNGPSNPKIYNMVTQIHDDRYFDVPIGFQLRPFADNSFVPILKFITPQPRHYYVVNPDELEFMEHKEDEECNGKSCTTSGGKSKRRRNNKRKSVRRKKYIC